MFASLPHDLRFAWRVLLRQPVLTASTALTLAIGAGANTAIVSVVKTALINPLGLRHSDQVVVARVHLDKLKMRRLETSGVEFREISGMTDTFAATAAMEGRWWTYETNGEATRMVGQAVTPQFFQLFGERPELGRFLTGDDRESIVLSHAFWRSAFGADRAVLNRILLLDGKPYHVVGVAAADFRFPTGAEGWAPLVLSPERLQRRGYNMKLTLVAKLKTG